MRKLRAKEASGDPGALPMWVPLRWPRAVAALSAKTQIALRDRHKGVKLLSPSGVNIPE